MRARASSAPGPFKFVSWAPKGDLVMDRFDDYWGGKAHWQRHIRREISQRCGAARGAARGPGRHDQLRAEPGLCDAGQEQPRYGDQGGFRSTSSSSISTCARTRRSSFDAAGNKPAKNPLANPKVREAIDLAIDRQSIADNVLEGIGSPATTPWRRASSARSRTARSAFSIRRGPRRCWRKRAIRRASA